MVKHECVVVVVIYPNIVHILQLSATRVQIKYNKETGLSAAMAVDDGSAVPTSDDDFRDELLEKVEVLMAEKADAVRQLQESRIAQQEQKRQLEAAKQQAQLDKFNAAAKEKERSKSTAGNGQIINNGSWLRTKLSYLVFLFFSGRTAQSAEGEGPDPNDVGRDAREAQAGCRGAQGEPQKVALGDGCSPEAARPRDHGHEGECSTETYLFCLKSCF